MVEDAKGFTSLLVRFSEGITALSHLYVRSYKGTQDGLPKERTLFVTGLPFLHHPQDAVLGRLFAAFGKIERVAVHQTQLSALVLFVNEDGKDRALKAATDGNVIELPLPAPTGAHGLKGWVEEHKAKFPGNHVLKQQLDDWTEEFEKREEEDEAAAAAAADDGWTVVTRRPGRRKTTDDAGLAVGGVRKAVAEARAARKPVKQLENFYRHQRRDKQRNALLELRQKFEEDKKKIAEMKAARRFKPY